MDEIISVSVDPIVQLFKIVSISPGGSSQEVWKSTTWVVLVYFAVHWFLLDHLGIYMNPNGL